jgi:hypothetical protein
MGRKTQKVTHMRTSLYLPTDLVADLLGLAEAEHRSMNQQVIMELERSESRTQGWNRGRSDLPLDKRYARRAETPAPLYPAGEPPTGAPAAPTVEDDHPF